MKQLKVNLGTIATNADQIFHRLRWANGVAYPKHQRLLLRYAHNIGDVYHAVCVRGSRDRVAGYFLRICAFASSICFCISGERFDGSALFITLKRRFSISSLN